MAGKVAYRPSGGGSWTDVTTEITGSEASYDPDSFEPTIETGAWSMPVESVTGLTTDGDYEFGVFLRKASGTVAGANPSGNITAEAP